jgi:hypothetical protein
MSGFPQTAINTYDQFAQMQKDEKEKVRQELVLSEEEKRKLLPLEVYPFSLSFFMSKKHWQKEMEIPKKMVRGDSVDGTNFISRLHESF